MSAYSMNDFFILEPYKQGQGLREEVSNGFAKVAQKVTLVGLKVLIPAKTADGHYVPAGSVAYLPEDMLSTQPWAKQVKKGNLIDQDFIVVEKRNVICVVEAVAEHP